jgi:hypothetical protein
MERGAQQPDDYKNQSDNQQQMDSAAKRAARNQAKQP